MPDTRLPYGAPILRLVSEQAFEQYGTDFTNQDALRELEALGLEDLFPNGYTDRSMAKSCLAGLFLLHNQLELSHEISQSMQTPEGSFWHAILHRIEGDFWNCMYWYRRVGEHPVFNQLFEQSATILATSDPIIAGGRWNANAFVARCEHEFDAPTIVCQQLMICEWKLLFDHCFQHAK